MAANLLLLNPDKTDMLVLGHTKQRELLLDLRINLDGCTVVSNKTVKDLGVSQQHTTLHTTAGLLLKLSRVGPGQFLDGGPDAAGSGVGGPIGGTLSSGLKNIPMPQGSGWGHCSV